MLPCSAPSMTLRAACGGSFTFRTLTTPSDCCFLLLFGRRSAQCCVLQVQFPRSANAARAPPSIHKRGPPRGAGGRMTASPRGRQTASATARTPSTMAPAVVLGLQPINAITAPTRKVPISTRRGNQVNAVQLKPGLAAPCRCPSTIPNRAASAARDQNQAEPPSAIKAIWKLMAGQIRPVSRKVSMSCVYGGTVSAIPPSSSTAAAARMVRSIDRQE